MEFRLSAHSIDVSANGSKGNYYAQAKSSISSPVYSGPSASIPRGLRRVRHNGQSRTHEFFSFPNFLVCRWSRLHTDSEWHRVYSGFDGAMERIESQNDVRLRDPTNGNHNGRGLDRRPSPVLAFSEASDRAYRQGVLADVFAHQPESYKVTGGHHKNGWRRLRELNHVSKALSEQPLH